VKEQEGIFEMSGLSVYALQDRVAVVTGAARGIGTTIARHLMSLGATVVLTDRNLAVEETARRLEREDEGYAGRASTRVFDVTDSPSVEAAAKDVVQTYGRIDILVANAGIAFGRAAVDHSDEDWRSVMAVNLDGVFYTARAFAPAMIAQRAGAMVLISSIAGVKAVRPEKHVGYDVAKAGVAHMARVLAIEWARSGVRVNAVGPGYVDTELLAEIGRAQPEVMKIWLDDMPNGRLMRQEEIAATVGFLVSDAASGITGHLLMADGGYSVS
jgi:NAD(P)-dependent dehydrogenase (short-subunit alcohol dehydrogenase family)